MESMKPQERYIASQGEVVAYALAVLGFRGRPMTPMQIAMALPRDAMDGYRRLVEQYSGYGSRGDELADGFVDDHLMKRGLVVEDAEMHGHVVLTEHGENWCERAIEASEKNQETYPLMRQVKDDVLAELDEAA